MPSRKELEEQIREMDRDRRAFVDARDCLQKRLAELDGTPRYEFLHEWAGFLAVMNTLIMAITRCEGVIEDLQANLERFPEPKLQLVQGENDGD